MTHKRKAFESQDGERASHSKRFRFNEPNGNDDLPSSSQPRLDPTYGQRGAFPGLDGSHDHHALFYGPASDGIEYLRMVRSEAKTVPNLLVAAVSPIVDSKKTELYGDYPQGYYSDGAYTAIPHPQPHFRQSLTNDGQQEDQDPQEAYYASLFARFTELSQTLQSFPPRAEPDNTNVYYLGWRGFRFWRGKILNTTPRMVLLAQLTQESVVCGLGVLGSLSTLKNLRGNKGKIIGAWAWGLLGRCREVGQMSSEEVGVLRKLGKQAVWSLRRISAGEMIGGAEDEPDVNAGEEDVDGKEEHVEERGGDGEEEYVDDVVDFSDVDGGYSPSIDPITTSLQSQNGNSETHPPPTTKSDTDVARAKQRILDSLANSQSQTHSPDTNANNEDELQTPTPTCPVTTEVEMNGEGCLTESAADGEKKATIHATLDMLVTVIGEFYGQRDLLDGRLLWDEMQ